MGLAEVVVEEQRATRVGREGRVRYAVVGLGWISQAAFMPGVEHTANSEMVALVTSDREKAQKLGEMYGIEKVYDYSEYDAMLYSGDVDAVYLALPNFEHVDYAVRTLEAGVHLLLEKPMAVSVEQCERIIAASKRSGAKLMVAYRLHHEPGTLAAIEKARSHQIGTLRLFNSTFSQPVAAGNHRARNGFWAGPVPDMGPYPLNTVRNLFGAEPVEVFAMGVNTDPSKFDFEDTVVVTLRFEGARLAAFMLSYNGGDVDDYRIVGAKGDLFSQPAFQVGLTIEHLTTVHKKKTSESYRKTDQFGGELQYFSECILEDRQPEADGEEALLDLRVLAAIEESMKTGIPQRLTPHSRSRRPVPEQGRALRPVDPPDLVHAAKPSDG